jgi:hypothetical protein
MTEGASFLLAATDADQRAGIGHRPGSPAEVSGA